MELCDFVNGVCKNCGYRLPGNISGRVFKHCPAIRLTVPQLWQEFREARKRFKAAGSPTLDPSERLAICHTCERRSVPFDVPILERCQACGCFVRLKAKWATEHCPLGKWPGDPERPAGGCGGCQKENRKTGTYESVADLPKIARVLLRWPHGLGDAVQGTVLIKHLQYYHPEWTIHCAAKWGQESVFYGLAEETYTLDSNEPPHEAYELATRIDWWDPEDTYDDSPSTKSERCLRDVFKLHPLPELCRYEINLRPDLVALVEEYKPKTPYCCIHYQGNSATENKTIDQHAIRAVLDVLTARGVTPVILDWNHRSGLLKLPGVVNFPAGHPMWGGRHGTGEAGSIAALVSGSVLNIGIDSGPGHIMGACDVPALITWLNHHPVQYYCLAPNVTHVVSDFHWSTIFGDQERGRKYFEANYRHHILQKDLRLELPALVEERLK